MNFAIFAFLSFISGSIPFGYWIALRFGKMDIRKFGSKNIGATNVGRSIGWKFGFPVLVLDVAKGIFPVYPSGIYVPEGEVPFQLACGVLAVLGHMFSPFLGFKGGKGVATTLGVFLVLTPIACFGAILVFLVTIKYFKFVSIGSIFVFPYPSARLCFFIDSSFTRRGFVLGLGNYGVHLHWDYTHS